MLSDSGLSSYPDFDIILLLNSQGSFLKQRWLGGGATGEVYAATLLGVPLTLKLAPWEGAEEHEEELHAAERLHREAQMYLALAGSSGAACTPLLIAYGCLRNNSGRRRMFLATSLIDGGRPLVEAAGHLPAAKAGDLSRAAFSALHQLHQAGAVHGDVSMGNVLLDHAGRAWLIDLEHVQLDASEAELRDDFEHMSEVVRTAVRATGLDSEAEIEQATWQGQQLYLSSTAPPAAVQSTSGGPESSSASSRQVTAWPPAEVPVQVTKDGGRPEYGYGGSPAARALKPMAGGSPPGGRVAHGRPQLPLPKRLSQMRPPRAIRRLNGVRPAARLPM